MCSFSLATATTQPAGFDPGNMGVWLALLAAMALLPFLLTMVSSFAKIVIVGGILRQALGMPNVPPNSVLTGLALLLSIHVMAPQVEESWANYQQKSQARAAAGQAAGTREMLDDAASSVEGPLRRFLEKHADRRNVALFQSLSERLHDGQPPVAATPLQSDRAQILTILAPAFILTELTKAFLIGFIIYVPFLVIDLVVSNVLLAMGMHMLSPVTISLPLKLLLFVMIDGWRLLLSGLALGYA